MILTKELAQKVRDTVDAGLSKGMGNPIPGQMCVEAAVNYAMGLPHGDTPSCVGRAVRDFKIALNDSDAWTSNAARAKGLRRVAIAQLGSDKLDQVEFSKALALDLAGQAVAYGGNRALEYRAALELRLFEPVRVEFGWQEKRYDLTAGAYALDATLRGLLLRIGVVFQP